MNTRQNNIDFFKQMVGWDRRALKSWRQEKGLTQKRLAQALGVTPMAVAYW